MRLPPRVGLFRMTNLEGHVFYVVPRFLPCVQAMWTLMVLRLYLLIVVLLLVRISR